MFTVNGVACDGFCLNGTELVVTGVDLFDKTDCADGDGTGCGPIDADAFVIVKLGLDTGKGVVDCGFDVVVVAAGIVAA